MKDSNITFVLFSYNEEFRIEYVVRNLIPYGEVLVFDGGSTDRTKEVVEKFGGKYIRRIDLEAGFQETPEMFDFVMSHVKTDWVLWSYVDNLLPKALLDKMEEISKQEKYKYVYVPIDTYMWGNTKHPVIRASYPNFFHKNFVDFKGNRIHGLGKFLGEKHQILHLPKNRQLAIRHYSLYDVNKFVNKHMAYAETEAKDKLEHGRKFSLLYMLGSMGKYFLLFYRYGWRAGIVGLYTAFLYVSFRLMVAVKLFELENNLSLENIEKKFALDKRDLVRGVEERNHA